MAGRPPKPVLLKAADGDTRKLGARKFAASLGAAIEPVSGPPPFPGEALRAPRLPKEATIEQRAMHAAMRQRLRMAAKYWHETVEHLERQGLLVQCDGDMILGMAMSRALMDEAFRDGDVQAFTALNQRVMQSSNLMGTNNSARAKLPKPSTPTLTAAEEMCG